MEITWSLIFLGCTAPTEHTHERINQIASWRRISFFL